MIDNYGEEVPTDLVLIPDIEHFDNDEVRLIVDAVWYDVVAGINENIWLCTSAAQINNLSDDSIDHYDGPIIEVMRINDVLKRWNDEDGFYHA